jgi:hypothetical protein
MAIIENIEMVPKPVRETLIRQCEEVFGSEDRVYVESVEGPWQSEDGPLTISSHYRGAVHLTLRTYKPLTEIATTAKVT